MSQETSNKSEKCQHNIKNNECNIFNSYEKLTPIEKLTLSVDVFKYKWGKWTLKTLGWSLLLIFIMSIVATTIDYKVAPENQQQITKIFGVIKIFELLQVWVSFGLGIIAMLFSIISMFLSFYNLEQQKASEEKNFNYLKDLKTNIVNETKEETKKELTKILNFMENRFKTLEEIAQETNKKVQEANVTQPQKITTAESESLKDKIYGA